VRVLGERLKKETLKSSWEIMRARGLRSLFDRVSTEKNGNNKVPTTHASVEEKEKFEKKCQEKRFSTTTTTITPNVFPLTRGLGRSNYKQLYSCKCLYLQRG